MKILITLALSLLSLTALAADKATKIFTLDHQMSQNCEKRIKSNLRFEKGVQNIDVSLKENTITISYNPEKTNADKLLAAFKKIGFNATLVTPKESGATSKTNGKDNKKESGKDKK